MDWRVIIRWSFDGDTGSAMRNALGVLLAECGIYKKGSTSTWECDAVDPDDAAKKIGEVLRRLANPTGVAPHFKLDHIWIYIDRAAEGAPRAQVEPTRKPGRPRIPRDGVVVFEDEEPDEGESSPEGST